MKAWFKLLCLCFITLANPWLWAANISLTVPFNCPQISGITFPAPVTITITDQKKSPQVQAQEFVAALQTLRQKNPNLDLSSCVEQWISNCDETIKNHPQASKIPKKELWTNILEETANYQFDSNGKPPYIAPLSELSPEPNLDSLQAPQCGADLNESYLAKSILENKLKPLVANLAKPCQTKLARNYARILLESKCTRSKNMMNHLEECIARDKQIAKASKVLSDSGLPGFKKIIEDYQNEPTCNHYEATNTMIDQLQDLASAMDELNNCSELAVGEAKNIDNDTGTGLPAQYRLKKIADDTFEVMLNLNIVDHGIKPDNYKNWPTKIEACFKATDSLLTIPKAPPAPPGSKQTIKLSLYNATSDTSKPVPPQVNVDISKNHHARGHAKLWVKNFSCNTIIHEVLHILGLVDEYQETLMGMAVTNDGSLAVRPGTDPDVKFIGFDCRAQGPKDSIMYDQYEAYTVTQNTVNQKTKKSSLLYPAHFRAIVYPGCASKNRQYYLCAKESYKSSRKRMGLRSQNCSTNLPLECAQGGEGWLK